MAWKGADGQAALEIRRQADLNDARKRGRSPSADRRRGWARGGLPRTAFPRAPPPEARRAKERGRTPRRTPPIFTPRATPEAEASERQRASSTRSRASGEDSRPLRRPRPAASAAGPWPKRGRLSPSGARAPRGSSVAARQRRAYGGKPRKGGQRSGGARGA